MSAIRDIAAKARAASRQAASLTTAAKNAVLEALATTVVSGSDEILRANARDLDAARAAGLPGAKLSRLELSAASLAQMAEGLRQVAALPDPVGQVTRVHRTSAGLHVRKVRAPLGVIAMIYEARPGVTIDAFALCFKAGNACILKGGREAGESNAALAALAHDVLAAHGVPRETLTLITTSDRNEIRELLSLEGLIDLVIPRGGESLIRFVHEHSRVPTVQHFKGVCHIYVDRAADLDRAVDICATAKTSAPATCNAVECVLVHSEIAPRFVPRLVERLVADGVEVRAEEAARRAAGASGARLKPASEADWGREFLDLTLALRVVEDLDEAVAHIGRYGTNHTEAILTVDEAAAAAFTARVQSSCVLVNASTRFNDGFQLGLGAEIGISTSRVHAYGPMGLEELTTQRYIVVGEGQTR